MPWTPGPFAMDPRLAWIVNVYTEHAHRKRGLARRLMNEMHDWCRSRGIERTALNASSAGQPIYESMGYTLADEPMMRTGFKGSRVHRFKVQGSQVQGSYLVGFAAEPAMVCA